MPQGCRVFLLQQAKRSGRLGAILSTCGYGITPSDGRDVAVGLFMSGPCVLLLDVAGGGERIDEVVRIARVAGVPIIAVGEPPGRPIRGIDHRLSGTFDDVALVAAVEVACYGHDHRGTDGPARRLATTAPHGGIR